MNQTEMIAAIAHQTNMSKLNSEKFIKSFEKIVGLELLKGGNVQLVGFGTFEVSKRVARCGRDPKTGLAVNIPASRAPKFKAAKLLKERVNGKKQMTNN